NEPKPSKRGREIRCDRDGHVLDAWAVCPRRDVRGARRSVCDRTRISPRRRLITFLSGHFPQPIFFRSLLLKREQIIGKITHRVSSEAPERAGKGSTGPR